MTLLGRYWLRDQGAGLIDFVVEPEITFLMHVHAHDGFQVNASAAAGALFADAVGPGLGDLIPVSIQALDVFHLGDALPIGGIVVPPEGERIHIEILAVETEAGEIHEAFDDLEEIILHFGPAKIGEVSACLCTVGETPVGMIFSERCSDDNASGSDHRPYTMP